MCKIIWKSIPNRSKILPKSLKTIQNQCKCVLGAFSALNCGVAGMSANGPPSRLSFIYAWGSAWRFAFWWIAGSDFHIFWSIASNKQNVRPDVLLFGESWGPISTFFINCKQKTNYQAWRFAFWWIAGSDFDIFWPIASKNKFRPDLLLFGESWGPIVTIIYKLQEKNKMSGLTFRFLVILGIQFSHKLQAKSKCQAWPSIFEAFCQTAASRCFTFGVLSCWFWGPPPRFSKVVPETDFGSV